MFLLPILSTPPGSGPGEDNTPPTITGCPADIVEPIESGTFATVGWTEPTATDESGSATLEFQNKFPNSFFEVNQPEEVIYTFSDPSGNEASCTFTVSVIRMYTVICYLRGGIKGDQFYSINVVRIMKAFHNFALVVYKVGWHWKAYSTVYHCVATSEHISVIAAEFVPPGKLVVTSLVNRRTILICYNNHHITLSTNQMCSIYMHEVNIFGEVNYN